MIKTVIDTNVFVSGIFWKGPPHQVLEAWQENRFRLVISLPIMEEYRRVVRELASIHHEIGIDRILELVELHADAVVPLEFLKPVCADPDDDKFLAAALTAGAQFVVSGDKALLATNGYKGLRVLSPRKYLVALGRF